MYARTSATPLGARIERSAPFADSSTDSDLVLRAIEGDRWAKGAIYRRHAPAIVNVAGRLLGSASDAMDVLHDVFIEALEDLESLRNPQALRAWLLRRTVRRVRRHLRRRRFRRMLGLDPRNTGDELESVATPAISPEDRAELERVWRVLGRIPDRQRIAWILHHVEGETLPAVAEACGVSLATIKREIAAAAVSLAAHKEGRR